MPALTVLTPIYNCEEFVFRCYSMLRDQTFADWEWVVVDDGSTDCTAELVASIPDDRIKLTRLPHNKGRGFARTRGLAEATGEWVVIWDADDMYFPDRLAKTNDARLQGYDFCCSYMVLASNDLQIKGVRGYCDYPAYPSARIFLNATLGCRRELMCEIGYPERESVGEDTTITLVLSSMYRGLWYEDAFSIYQEENSVSLKKAIAANLSQYRQERALCRRGVMQMNLLSSARMHVARIAKLVALNAMRLWPSAYLLTVSRRKPGTMADNWVLPEQRVEFIEQLRARDFQREVEEAGRLGCCVGQS